MGRGNYGSAGALAVGRHLYQFINITTTFGKPVDRVGVEHHSIGAKLIHSPDYGRTWFNRDGSTPLVWKQLDKYSRDNLIFFEEPEGVFHSVNFLQMGRGYEDNQDGYVYGYSRNGNNENEIAVFRVEKKRILDRDSYECFMNLNGDGATWTKDMESRGVVHSLPAGSSMGSIVYNAPLGLYMMTECGSSINAAGTQVDNKPSRLGIWIAAHRGGRGAKSLTKLLGLLRVIRRLVQFPQSLLLNGFQEMENLSGLPGAMQWRQEE